VLLLVERNYIYALERSDVSLGLFMYDGVTVAASSEAGRCGVLHMNLTRYWLVYVQECLKFEKSCLANTTEEVL
jgi:hypothetical protein